MFQRICGLLRTHNIPPKKLHEWHISIVLMKALARSYFWRPGLDQQIEALAACCDACKSTTAMPS